VRRCIVDIECCGCIVQSVAVVTGSSTIEREPHRHDCSGSGEHTDRVRSASESMAANTAEVGMGGPSMTVMLLLDGPMFVYLEVRRQFYKMY
jgi:hypothetical protein